MKCGQTLACVILMVMTLPALAQNVEDKARELAIKAIKEMDAGKIHEAKDLLLEAIELDPNSINYPYELAYAYYLEKDFAKVIEILEGLLQHAEVYDRIYQMLGNAYSMNKEPDRAIEIYDAGLELFPHSGLLHLERGNMELFNQNFTAALVYYEKGIDVAPEFPSNYYWASKIYCASSEEVWGMIYGEIFMNLERNSGRTAEISKLLYDTYKSAIQFTSDTSSTVSFSQHTFVDIESLKDPENFTLPFAMGVYEPIILFAIIAEKSIDLTSLNRIRTRFVESYFKGEHNKKYPNILFDYQRRMLLAGHLEAYNHWILMKGAEDSFTEWLTSNKEQWEEFVKWFKANPLHVDKSHRFHRTQY